jgi:hypothetical protein
MADRQNRQPAVLNQRVAHALWELISTEITFRKLIVRRPKRELVGFVDLELSIPEMEGFRMGFRNLQVVLLNGKQRLDMPCEKSKKDGKWYPIYYPLSYELREVLTQRAFRHAEVIAAVQDLPNHPVAASASEAKGPNPFFTQAEVTSAAAEAAGDPNPFASEAEAPLSDEAEIDGELDELEALMKEAQTAIEAKKAALATS